MSVIRKPDENGVSQVDLGGIVIGTIQKTEDGFRCKNDRIDETHPIKNLAVKALVTEYRNQ